VCTSSCLDQCATGVTVLVEPDHFFYGRVMVADVPEIVDGLVRGNRLNASWSPRNTRSGRRRGDRKKLWALAMTAVSEIDRVLREVNGCRVAVAVSVYLLTDLLMSKVERMESELRKLSQAELRQVREWLDDIIEDELEFMPEFEHSIEQSERDMADRKVARVREPEHA
jgi:(2Fe-2S) ferredoxin